MPSSPDESGFGSVLPAGGKLACVRTTINLPDVNTFAHAYRRGAGRHEAYAKDPDTKDPPIVPLRPCGSAQRTEHLDRRRGPVYLAKAFQQAA
jgi:hypothetical protein